MDVAVLLIDPVIFRKIYGKPLKSYQPQSIMG